MAIFTNGVEKVKQYALIQYVIASGSNGGTATNGSWLKVPLNTLKSTNISGVSLTSNEITLPAGTYLLRGGQSFGTVVYAQLRFRNTTDTSTEMSSGLRKIASAGDRVDINGIFTIATSKVFELQYEVDTTKADDGLGTGAANYSEENVFGYVFLERL